MEWNSKDSKKLWKLLEKLEHKKGVNNLKESIPSKTWNEHFKKVFQSCTTVKDIPQNTHRIGPLDFQMQCKTYKIFKREMNMRMSNH